MSKTVLSYDGGFPGFLCCVAEAINMFHDGYPFPNIREAAYREELFDEAFSVRRDEARAAALWLRLSLIGGEAAMRACHEAYCSDFPAKEDAIARALARIFREGRGALNDLGDPAICLVEKAGLRAKAQAHLVAGLIRFSELSDGSWFATIEPDCDVLPLIADHFAVRYADMIFAIYDKKRSTALMHKPGSPWKIVDGFSIDTGDGQESNEAHDPPLSERELSIRAGWIKYFDSIAIVQRKNSSLQSGRMPKKYWPLLPEMRTAAKK